MRNPFGVRNQRPPLRDDIITKGLVTLAQASKLFNGYFASRCNDFHPVLNEHLDTFESVRERSSFLLAVVCAIVASFTPDAANYRDSLQEEAANQLAASLINPPSFESIQAAILVSLWSLGGTDPWLSASHAVKLCQTYGISNLIPPDPSIQPLPRQVASRLHLYLYIFSFDRWTSAFAGHSYLLREDETILGCKTLCVSEDEGKYKRLVALVELSRIIGRITDDYGADRQYTASEALAIAGNHRHQISCWQSHWMPWEASIQTFEFHANCFQYHQALLCLSYYAWNSIVDLDHPDAGRVTGLLASDADALISHVSSALHIQGRLRTASDQTFSVVVFAAIGPARVLARPRASFKMHEQNLRISIDRVLAIMEKIAGFGNERAMHYAAIVRSVAGNLPPPGSETSIPSSLPPGPPPEPQIPTPLPQQQPYSSPSASTPMYQSITPTYQNFDGLSPYSNPPAPLPHQSYPSSIGVQSSPAEINHLSPQDSMIPVSQVSHMNSPMTPIPSGLTAPASQVINRHLQPPQHSVNHGLQQQPNPLNNFLDNTFMEQFFNNSSNFSWEDVLQAQPQ